ncbi:Fic family protein [Desulfitobacterium hafniense]|uniref:Fic family protein n=1 Tax=Desulfitobacterium hafniense TaxID=49338 RepID=UPI0009B6F1D0
MSELNMIHPFREGNGRSIREFTKEHQSKCSFVNSTMCSSIPSLINKTIHGIFHSLRIY